MNSAQVASLEFAAFLADVSDPATGVIRSDRLCIWINRSEEQLIGDWRSSGVPEWTEFAREILAVLDALQDIALSLPLALDWYKHVPLLPDSGWTAADCMAKGVMPCALIAVRKMRKMG